jgi:homoserine kinase type II
MAVYTEVSDEELAAFIGEFDIGPVVSCKGIAEGVENSNYLVHTKVGRYILTLYEKRVAPADLPFFLGLMEHLAARGFPCPVPVRARDGESLRILCGRPAALISFLEGMWPRRIHPWHCAEVGSALAQMHLGGADFPMQRPNNLSVADWRPLFEACRKDADGVVPGLAMEIAAELERLEAEWPKELPKGVIHADLFPDNVFFLGEKLSGVIDFYFACTDFTAYDLAVCLNAWCFEADGALNATKAMLLTSGYRRVRPLQPEETAALPLLARGSAMRFLLTRLYDWVNTPPGALVKRKDPKEYLQKLRFHQGVRGPGDYGIEA